MTGSSADLAAWVVDQVVSLGVEHVVLAPGSRSAPLAFALEACDRITLHTRIDERTAGFLALGMAKGSRRPAAVVTTSGTAVANLHPAILEASHAGVPLIALTADRPADLRGTGANQTTDQVRMFGEAAACEDISVAGMGGRLGADWDRRSPLQLNVQFAEPLVPDGAPLVSAGRVRRRAASRDRDATVHELSAGPRTVVVAGDDAGGEGRQIAEAGNWPILAEPTSGSRAGGHALRAYRLLLQTPLAGEIERAIVVGHPTLSRPVAGLLAREDVEVVSVRSQGRWPSRPFSVAVEADAVRFVGEREHDAWLDRWRAADRELARRVDRYVAGLPGLTPYEVAAEVAAALPERGLLWVGASNPIRDLDLMAEPVPVGGHRMLMANRGLAGIDGTLSSAVGAALVREPSRALAYVGDVTFLHDLTALVLGPEEIRPDLTIVVANDNGGSIFATLEQGAPEYAPSFERLFATPHDVDLASLCAAFRIPHWRVDSRAELSHALASANGGIEVVEAAIQRGDRRRWEAELRDLAVRRL